MSGHLLENGCPFDLQYVFLVYKVPDSLFSFFPSRFFGVGIFFLIVPFPDYCLLLLLLSKIWMKIRIIGIPLHTQVLLYTCSGNKEGIHFTDMLS